jgi:hypothetical protein
MLTWPMMAVVQAAGGSVGGGVALASLPLPPAPPAAAPAAAPAATILIAASGDCPGLLSRWAWMGATEQQVGLDVGHRGGPRGVAGSGVAVCGFWRALLAPPR